MSLEEVDRLARLPYSVVISCELELNFNTLLSLIWDYLSLLRLYTKKRGGIDTYSVRDTFGTLKVSLIQILL